MRDKAEVYGYNQELEKRFSIKRATFGRDKYEIQAATCQVDELAACLAYVEEAGFFTYKWQLNVAGQQFIVLRHGESGRAHLHRDKGTEYERRVLRLAPSAIPQDYRQMYQRIMHHIRQAGEVV